MLAVVVVGRGGGGVELCEHVQLPDHSEGGGRQCLPAATCAGLTPGRRRDCKVPKASSLVRFPTVPANAFAASTSGRWNPRSYFKVASPSATSLASARLYASSMSSSSTGVSSGRSSSSSASRKSTNALHLALLARCVAWRTKRLLQHGHGVACRAAIACHQQRFESHVISDVIKR